MSNKKVILVTGASSGMGKLSAQDLIKAGHTVYAVARSVDKMKDLEALGGHIMKMDVTNEEDIEKVVAQQFEVNVYGVARLTKKVLPYMRAQKEGLIINTSSMGGKIYTSLGAWYHASKHAIEGFSDCLRMEVKEFGIKVVVLEPGMINTGFNATVGQNFSYESKNGAYSRLVNGYIKAMENNPTPGSNPEVISRTVLKIINARNPKTRYLVGRGGKLLVGIRRIFGDKFFDRMMLMSMR